MRKGVDYIGVGVGGVIINKDKKIFCARRGPKAKNEAGKWDFPGGSIEFGEDLREALVREIKEEYDFMIKPVRLLGVCNHIISEENQHWVSPSFLCKVVSGRPRIMESHKCTAIKWLGLGEVGKLDLTITSKHDYLVIKRRFKKGLPDFY